MDLTLSFGYSSLSVQEYSHCWIDDLTKFKKRFISPESNYDRMSPDFYKWGKIRRELKNTLR